MFNKFYVIVADTEEDIYRMIRVATSHRLYVTYKIGVYGSERQHELCIVGNPWNYRKFKRAVETTITKVNSEEGGVQ